MADDDLQLLRRDYGERALRRHDLPDDPRTLLQDWLAAAADAGVSEPNAMALATCSRTGEDVHTAQPHCRIVLLKQLDERGLAFFTNRDSDKGRQLAANSRAAVTFWWSQPADRQVRVLGGIEAVDDAESEAYFRARPRAAQLAAAASPQSRVVADRAALEAAVDGPYAAIGDGPVPRPAGWGGYRLVPREWEFWQGRTGRLHDRFRYRQPAWVIERLAP